MLGLGFAVGQAGGARARPEIFLGAALRAFWDAERPATIQVVDGAVAAWSDLKGGHVASQAAPASRPAYLPSGFHGRPGVAFDGADDVLNMSGVGGLPVGAAPCEIWLLARQDMPASTPTSRVLFRYGSGAMTGLRRISRNVAGGINRAAVGVGNGSALVEMVDGQGDYSGTHLLRARIGPTETSIQLGKGAATVQPIVPATATTSLQIGAASNAPLAVISAILVIDPTAAGWNEGKAERLARWLDARRAGN